MKKMYQNFGVVIAVAFVFLMAGKTASATTFPHPGCSISTKSGDIVVNFNDGRMLSTTGNVHTYSYSADIPAGNYEVMLEAFDGYTGRVNATQPNERYFVKFMNGDTELAKSGSTGDLPDFVEKAIWKGTVSEKITLGSKSDQVKTVHSVYPDNSSPNSVAGACMVLRPIDKEETEPICGNKAVETGEQCDDGNTKNGDGCDSVCKKEDDEDEEEEEDCDSSIGDEVWFDSNQNGIKDAGEKGIPGVTLKMIFGNSIKKKNTNSSGEYKFDSLCEGTYTVVVDSKDIPKGCYQVYDPDGKMDNMDKVKIGEDEKYRKSDFGYFCSNTQKAPATGPGSIIAILSAGLAGISALTIKKRKSIISKIKGFRK